VGVGEGDGDGLGASLGLSLGSSLGFSLGAADGVLMGFKGGGVGGGVACMTRAERRMARYITAGAFATRAQTSRRMRFLDDFAIGATFQTGTRTLDEGECLAFARDYDPQPFHLDAQAASATFFRGLVASGWQTAAMTMRLIVDSGVLRESGIIGTGIDELRWLAPVRPGDTLRVEGEVIEKLPWPNNPTRGIARIRMKTINQEGAVVMTQIANLVLPIRPA
jgi:acyl dehydratase